MNIAEGRFTVEYHKVTKFWDTRKLCCNLPQIQTKRPKLRVCYQNDANEIANSEDPDQTAPSRSSLIWVCTVCPDLSVRKLRVITVMHKKLGRQNGKQCRS